MQITVRNLRILAAVALGGAVIWATAPYATSYVSSQAVVNAPLNTVLSPMQGHITRRSPPAGTGVATGEALITIELEERDRRYLGELRARLALLDESLGSTEAEEAKLDALEEVMTTRISNYRARMLDRLAAEMREAGAALSAAEARRDNAVAVLTRSETLIRNGHATTMRIEADLAAHAAAVAEVLRLGARLERVQIETEAVEAGIFVQEGWNDVPYSQQRLDGIILARAALASEQRRIRGERAGIARQIAGEEKRVAGRETFSPVAPSGGVVWKESGAVGETVVPGDVLVQLVDCDARFVEVTLAERHFGAIAPGDTAWVRLKGGGDAVSARVTAVLGAGAKFDHPRLAASVSEAKPDQLRVLVSLRDTAIGGEPGAFCHVGRTAEVHFGRRDLGVLSGVAQAFGEQVRSVFAMTGLTPALTGPTAARRPDPGLP
jgi:multidrug resistance efflux pump